LVAAGDRGFTERVIPSRTYCIRPLVDKVS
jgi:hypothetical protein